MQHMTIEIGGDRKPPKIRVHDVTVLKARNLGSFSTIDIGGEDEPQITLFLRDGEQARAEAVAEAFRSGEFGVMPGETALAALDDLAGALRARINGREGPATPGETAALALAERLVKRLGSAAPAAAAE